MLQLYQTLRLPSDYMLAQVTLMAVAIVVVAILRFLQSILEPVNYEVDMTANRYCKQMAEIDNQSIVRDELALERNSYPTSNRLYERPNATRDCAKFTLNETSGSNGDKLMGANHNNNNNKSATDNNNIHTSEEKSQKSYVYPNGWIPVMESSKVQPATVKRAIILGKDVIVTRSADGKEVNVLAAYCPHMGVHIGVGGKLRQVNNSSCVECPFHGWTFRASDGQCVRIPYQKSGSIPKQAKLKSWLSVEINNFIYIWHHVDDQPPEYHLVEAPQLQLNDWQLTGRSCHTSNLDLRDMHENGADLNHFEGIHGDLFIFGGLITKLESVAYFQKYIRHHYKPEWKPKLDENGKQTHIAEMRLQSWISIFGFRVFDITIRAHQYGPTYVNLEYDSKWYGKGLLTMNAIPIGGRRVKYIQHAYCKRSIFQCFMAKWVLYGEINMLERDLFIWNHKKNLKNPIFIQEDKTLKQFRIWYSQFYKRKRTIKIGDSLKADNNEEIESVINCIKSLDF